MTNPFERAYQQAKASVLVVRHAQPGMLRLTGEDRLSFLHRMSTNNLEALPVGTLRATTLTTPLARVIDRLWLVPLADETLVLTSPGRAEAVEAWLKNHIFFNDDVQVNAPSHSFSLWGAYGPQALSHITELMDGDTAPKPGQVVTAPGGLLLGWEAPAGIRLLLNPEGEAQAAARWPMASDQVAVEVFETLRVEAGQPVFGSEFDDDSIPLEVGLRPTVDFDKGCYTGQEIIARMDSRGQLARTLVGFRLVERVEPGKLETKDGRSAGRLTSCANSPALGWIGLGVVRTKVMQGESLLYLSSNGQEVEIVTLPFDKVSYIDPPRN
jgi:aminomethyltransferase